MITVTQRLSLNHSCPCYGLAYTKSFLMWAGMNFKGSAMGSAASLLERFEPSAICESE